MGNLKVQAVSFVCLSELGFDPERVERFPWTFGDATHTLVSKAELKDFFSAIPDEEITQILAMIPDDCYIDLEN